MPTGLCVHRLETRQEQTAFAVWASKRCFEASEKALLDSNLSIGKRKDGLLI